jgi:hypothetical protein
VVQALPAEDETASLDTNVAAQRARCAQRKIPKAIAACWQECIVAGGLLQRGDLATALYLEQYNGTGTISEEKLIRLARLAETVDPPEVAREFWQAAFKRGAAPGWRHGWRGPQRACSEPAARCWQPVARAAPGCFPVTLSLLTTYNPHLTFTPPAARLRLNSP